MRKVFLLLTLISHTYILCSQNFKEIEDSIFNHFNEIQKTHKDHEKKHINEKIIHKFQKILSYNSSFYYPFNALKQIGKLNSPDGEIRIINWVIPWYDGTYNYYGFIQFQNPQKDNYQIFQLYDKSGTITQAETQQLNASNWYGALYYKIIEIEIGGKKYYTLLGWDGNNTMTTNKIIDILHFSEDNVPVFGQPIFQINKNRYSRIFFRYSKNTVMRLNYNEKFNVIIFDNLVPDKEKFTSKFEYYGPDASFNMFYLRDNLWNFKENINELKPAPPKKTN